MAWLSCLGFLAGLATVRCAAKVEPGAGARDGSVEDAPSRTEPGDADCGGKGCRDAGAAPFAYDAAACFVLASTYVQACSNDSDCVAVVSGNYCTGGPCFSCPTNANAAINAETLDEFNAAVTAVPVPPTDGGPEGCACGTGGGGAGENGTAAYCQKGTCVAGVPPGSGAVDGG